MKNIYILPTNKPSNLTVRTKTNELLYSYKLFSSKNGSDINVNQHIYITSDEEIKEGDYGLDVLHKEVRKFRNKNFVTKYDKKIILTTDQDLIKDGVQAIDDKFLEWFVKNPSCEEVEVEKMVNIIQFTSRQFIYKIIIPQEEPKQETLTYTEAAKKEERIFNSTMVSKQETLEEVAANLADPNLCKTDNWIAGAKWQAERMYSEEDMFTAMGFASAIDNNMDSENKLNLCIDFIKNFKNK